MISVPRPEGEARMGWRCSWGKDVQVRQRCAGGARMCCGQTDKRVSTAGPGAASACYWPGFLASLINRNWQDARHKIQAKFYWGFCCRGGSKNRSKFILSFSPWLGVGSWFSTRGGGRGFRPEEWLRGFAHPFHGVVLGGWGWGVWPVPCFCSRLFRGGSWAFWSFHILLPMICPNLHACSYF